MQCETFEQRLNQLLDERNRPEDDAQLSAHAADCPICREVLETQAAIFDTVRDWSVANLEVDLVARVLEQVPPSPPRASRVWWRSTWVRWTVGVAATAVIAVLTWQGVRWVRGVSSPAPMRDGALPEDIVGTPSDSLRDGQSETLDGTESRLFANSPMELARDLGEGVGQSVARGVGFVNHGKKSTFSVLRNLPRKPAPRNSSSSTSEFIDSVSDLA